MNKTQVEISNKGKILYTVAIAVISLVAFVSIIIFTYRQKASLSFPAIVALVMFGLVIFFAGFWVTVQGLRTIGYFCCSNCNEAFTPGVMNYMRTVHIFKTSYLKCPKCGCKSWCKKKIE